MLGFVDPVAFSASLRRSGFPSRSHLEQSNTSGPEIRPFAFVHKRGRMAAFREPICLLQNPDASTLTLNALTFRLDVRSTGPRVLDDLEIGEDGVDNAT